MFSCAARARRIPGYAERMCARAKLTTSGVDLQNAFGLRETPELVPHWNLAPTQDLAVIRTPGELEQLRFGLVPPFARDVKMGTRFLNARAETVATLPAYRSAFARRRCLVVLDGFYEWKATGPGGKVKQPYLFEASDGSPFALAGIWERWTSHATGEVVDSVAIVTCAAAPPVSLVHDREPVRLPKESYAAWLDAGTADPLTLLQAGAVELVSRPVSRAVSSQKNDGPSCVAPPEALQAELAGITG
jgi:putative SOS response-associated peptidase YedK